MLSEKAINGLISAPAEKRYKSFLNAVTDTETVWLVPQNINISTNNNESLVSLWPHSELASSNGEEVHSVEIHDFVEMCLQTEESTKFSIFPTNDNTFIVTAKKLVEDIIAHLEELE